jgi:hypothetical protein
MSVAGNFVARQVSEVNRLYDGVVESSNTELPPGKTA